MYSGRQPASTALIATFSASTTVFRPAISPSTWSRRSAAPASISAIDFSVGGTTGSPSVQPRSKYASIRLAGSDSPVDDMGSYRSGVAGGRACVGHPRRTLDVEVVRRPRERLGRGLAGRARPADRLEEALETGRRDQPEHDQLVVGLVDDLVLDVVAEEARRARHERMTDA